MLQKKFTKSSLAALSLVSAMAIGPSANAAVVAYAQDFEALDAGNPLALGVAGGEGFTYYTDVWFGDVGTTFLYAYSGSAPNGGPAFSSVATGEGGLYQGTQYLNIYTDYNNADQANSFNINSNVLQESTIDASDIGSTWTLTFDSKSPFVDGIADRNLTGGTPQLSSTTTTAFIKTLDPNNSFATTNDIRVDMTNVSNTEWGQYSISLDLTDGLLEGQLIQFGFNTIATDYDNSGVYYDNICFDNAGGCPGQPNPPAVPVPAAVWLFGSGLLGLVGVARRRKS